MSQLIEKQIEELLQTQTRLVAVPGGSRVAVDASRLHWSALKECQDYGWTEEMVVALAWQDAAETSRDFSFVLLGLIAHIQNEGRQFFVTRSKLPLLLSYYEWEAA